MKALKKVTVFLPDDLLSKAQEATGEGITSTIRHGLELVAARRAYAHFRNLRGKLDLSLNLESLRDDSK